MSAYEPSCEAVHCYAGEWEGIGAEKERAAILEIVQGAGCVCRLLKGGGEATFGQVEPGPAPHSIQRKLITHDPRCPEAIAARISARGGRDA